MGGQGYLTRRPLQPKRRGRTFMTNSTKPVAAVFNPRAKRIGPGVYRLSDIRDRCRIDRETGCWLWSMAVSTGGRPHSSLTPRVSLPKGVLSTASAGWNKARKDGKRISVSRTVNCVVLQLEKREVA